MQTPAGEKWQERTEACPYQDIKLNLKTEDDAENVPRYRGPESIKG